VDLDEAGAVRRWSAEHDGYESLDPPARHRRSVSLDEGARRIEVQDLVETSGRHLLRSALHLGPDVTCRLDAGTALLSWNAESHGEKWSATVDLDPSLSWSLHRGETNPMLGWYSSSFGTVEPTSVLLGEGHCNPGSNLLLTTISFSPRPEKPVRGRSRVMK
jgi:hypothetical protein